MAKQIVFLCVVIWKLGSSALAGGDEYGSGCPLGSNIYQSSCPEAESIIFYWVQKAVFQDSRMAASLLRLHFHDCFVNASPSLSLSLSYSSRYCQLHTNTLNLNFRDVMPRCCWMTERALWGRKLQHQTWIHWGALKWSMQSNLNWNHCAQRLSLALTF